MDEEDDVLIQTNMVIGNAYNSPSDPKQQSFEDDDIRELEQMVKYHDDEESQQEQVVPMQKGFKQNKQTFMQTQEVVNINRILKGNDAPSNLRTNGFSEENIYKKAQESLELETHQFQ